NSQSCISDLGRRAQHKDLEKEDAQGDMAEHNLQTAAGCLDRSELVAHSVHDELAYPLEKVSRCDEPD
ncbi:hypothetical protein M9458_025985, partial [Cirrhinus mrigala]